MKTTEEAGRKLKGSRIREELKLKKRRKIRSRKDKKFLTLILGLCGLVLFSLYISDSDTELPSTKKEVSIPISKEIKEPAIEKHVQVTQVMVVSTKMVEQEKQKEKKSIYNPDIPMPKEHQEYLYELCVEKGLDYKKTLALIKHESVFDQKAINETNDYGYFQINEVNHEELTLELQTANDPLDPYINMQWGTYMLADLYEYWADKGYHGQGLADAVWSSYNKGKTGFIERGHAVEYVSKMKVSIEEVNNLF